MAGRHGRRRFSGELVKLRSGDAFVHTGGHLLGDQHLQQALAETVYSNHRA